MAVFKSNAWLGRDWCHICGERSEYNVQIIYPHNAEHETLKDTPETHFVRICTKCLELAHDCAVNDRRDTRGKSK